MCFYLLLEINLVIINNMESKNKKLYIILIALFVLVLFSTIFWKGIGQRVSEKTVEKMIEKQIGGQADVDINGESVKVETDSGKVETGESVSLPSDFPEDVYVVDGAVKAVFSDVVNEGHTIMIETNKSPEEVSLDYKDKLTANSWKITSMVNFSGSMSIVAGKEGRTVAVVINKNDDMTVVSLSVSKK